MGAFFSGTDNGDDLHTIRFSAVAGHLSKPTPDTIWRFNFGSTKFDMKMEDVFQEPEKPAVDVPPEWIDNIKTFTSTSKYNGAIAQGGGRSNGQDFRVGTPGTQVGNTHGTPGRPVQHQSQGGWETGKGYRGQSWGPGEQPQQRTWPFKGAAGAVGSGTRAEQTAGVGFGFIGGSATDKPIVQSRPGTPTPYPTRGSFVVDSEGVATPVTEEVKPPALATVKRSFTVVPSGTGASGGATGAPAAGVAPGISAATPARGHNGSSPVYRLADGTWTSDLDKAWAEYEEILGMGGQGPVGDSESVQVKAQTPSQLAAEVAMREVAQAVISKTSSTLNPTMSAFECDEDRGDPFRGMEGTIEIKGSWVAPFDGAQAETGDNDFGDPVGDGSDSYTAEELEGDMEIIQRMRMAQGADEFGVGDNGYGDTGFGPEFERSTGVTAEEIAHHQRFDELMIMRGAEVATAFCFIDTMMGSLTGEDDLLADLIADLVMLMDEDKRLAAFRGLYEALPEDAKESIQTHGL